MGDHFVLLVDRLLTESTLEAAIQTNNRLQHLSSVANEDNVAKFSPLRMDTDVGTSLPKKLVECRICHDEDEESCMEVPCSCSGSLKYAHRRCVQKWCNEKGDTVCEICRKSFKPGYTAPSPLSHYAGIVRNFSFLDPDFDEHPSPSTRSLMCCRIVAIIFIVLLVLRHTLPIIIGGAGEYSLTLFMLVILRTIGILLPIYVMVKAFTAVQRCRHQQFSVSPFQLLWNYMIAIPPSMYCIYSRHSCLP
nr:E3 ubiquitin-protein ligase MARCH8-like isoform X4 [Coffea arabica]